MGFAGELVADLAAHRFVTSLVLNEIDKSQLTGWLGTVAGLNPVTYILEGLRSLAFDGWKWDELAKTVVTIAVVAALSMSMCFAALRGRVSQN